MARFAIERYVESKNRWRAIFGEPPLSLLNKADAQTIADSIDAELSPENLTCDGELGRAQVQKRYRELTRCAQELKALCPHVKFYEFN